MKTRDISKVNPKKITVSEFQVKKVYMDDVSKSLYIVLGNFTGQVVNISTNTLHSRYELSGTFTEVEAEVVFSEVVEPPETPVSQR